MNILFDTHAFLWATGSLGKDPNPEVSEFLESADTQIFVSVVSAWEIAIKQQLGKFYFGKDVFNTWQLALKGLLAEEISVGSELLIQAGTLDWSHRDPFDRVLAATAIQEDLLLVTDDKQLLSFPELKTLSWS